MSPSSGRYNSFVVRVWTPDTSGECLVGQITHVASRKTVRFRDPQQMVAFLLAQLGAEPRVPSVAVLSEEAS